MNISITKIGNTIKCKNDFEIKYFNVYESYYKINGNIIIIYSTGNSPENYTFAYNPILDTVVYNPVPTVTLTTVEDHADYLASIFFLANNSSIDNILNPNDFHIWENDFVSNYMNGTMDENDRYDTDISIGFTGTTGNYQLVANDLNDDKLYNGNFAVCMNKNPSGVPVTASTKRLLYNYTTSVYSDASTTKSSSNLSNQTDTIINTIIFKLVGNQWSLKVTNPNNAYFYYGYKVFSYKDIGFDINSITNPRTGLFALSYDANSNINNTNFLRLHVLNNAPILTSIPISTFINQYGRIDFVRRYYSSTNLVIYIYINGVLSYTYTYTSSDLSNVLYTDSNVAPFFQIGQTGLGSALPFGFAIDYILLAYTKYQNKKLSYYNNKII